MSGLYVDDPRLQKIYEACGKLGMPIISYLKKFLEEGKISRAAYNKINQKNAEKILKLEEE